MPILHEMGDYELVFVNDGSEDDSARIIMDHIVHDGRISLVNLSRNFGHQPALTAGLQYATGSAVVLMDADLQDPPELIPEMVREWENGAEVVVAQRRSRKEGFVRRSLFWTFYRVLSILSDYPITVNAGIFSLIDRKPLTEFLRLRERNRFIPGLRSWLGYRQRVVFYDREDRQAGERKQTMSRLISYALDAIFSFSYKPLRLALMLGLTISCLSFLYGLVLFVARIFEINLVRGYTSSILSILILGGMQLILIGLVGEYIGRIYDEVKQRPLFIIRDVIEHGSIKASPCNPKSTADSEP
ncbi:MAG: glycosyltransferase family 2 protein [Candidatus Abyssubacteria bacterium]